uniref:Uncharacterized protein n=1 Tax=Pseudo-nitzschia australis TaxID=44445 RepID=A0A7S4ACX2_9STRA|eukprot:CAMPEP_0168166760 /NCGR_PEP_ID=MMETSP0139_2-20121125/2198_1 /TAXON_ID=44445 /ORGANISM="Pseudo-nitzschia australis, Strain 10249 10 AB" /LENGTH=362 /DNA_ID=CAMNT_0008083977 /DNA_START=56 /DNA_END=1144 /DNA_ORIENTATION=-
MSAPADIELAGGPRWLTSDIPTATSSNTKNTDARTERNVISVDRVMATTIENNDNSNSNNAQNMGSAADAASRKTWKQYFQEGFQRDYRLLLVTLVIIICINIPKVKWGLYPFTIYSTWIHEFCHGMAAIIAGGGISKLEIFPDSSGLAYTYLPNSNGRAFVASAGYQGTALVGFLLLIFRRTKRGPRSGTMIIACTMILSCILWVRNTFGLVFILSMGLVFAGLALMLPSTHIRNLYTILAVTCSLNAIASIHDLFGSNYTVNGQQTETDAHTMADIKGGSYLMWAGLWLSLACVLTMMGIVLAIPGPDEVADFTCCGICQDFGLFKLCNYPGQRWARRIRGGGTNNNGGEGNSTDYNEGL